VAPNRLLCADGAVKNLLTHSVPVDIIRTVYYIHGPGLMKLITPTTEHLITSST